MEECAYSASLLFLTNFIKGLPQSMLQFSPEMVAASFQDNNDNDG